jgi:hypothetical protein
MSEQQNASEGQERVVIKVSQILEDLGNGLDREAIKAKYNLSHNDMSKLFSHEKLKGVRVKKAPSFILEDDVPASPIPTSKPKKEKAVKTEQVSAPTETAISETAKEEEEEVAASPTEVTAVDAPVAVAPEPIKEVATATDADAPVETKKDLW